MVMYTANDTFSGGSAGTDLNVYSTNWAQSGAGSAGLEIDGAGNARITTSAVENASRWVGRQFFSNHSSEAIVNVASDSRYGAACRMQTTAGNYYGVYATNSTIEIHEVVSGTVTLLGSAISPGWTAGTDHTLKISCHTSDLLIEYDSSSTTRNDTSFASGQPGVCGTATTAPGAGLIRSWAGSDVKGQLGFRTFNGTSDKITTSLGGDDSTALDSFTWVAVLFPTSITGDRAILSQNTSSGVNGFWYLSAGVQTIEIGGIPTAGPASTNAATDGHSLYAVTKASGTVAPRFHKLRGFDRTVSHGDSAFTVPNGSTPGAGGSYTIGATGAGTDFFAGQISMVGVFNGVLTDTQIEDLWLSANAWKDHPSARHVWRIEDPTITDLDGTANATSVTGTGIALGTGLQSLDGTDPIRASTGGEIGTSMGSNNAQTLASTPRVGDLYIAVASSDLNSTAGTITASTGWTELYTVVQGTNIVRQSVFARIMDGGANDVLSLTGPAQDYTVHNYRFINHGCATTADISTWIATTGSGGAPNPPAATGPVAKNWLALGIVGIDATTTTTVGSPAAPFALIDSRVSASSTSSVASGVSQKLLPPWLDGIDPGVWTSSSRPWVANTILIPPKVVISGSNLAITAAGTGVSTGSAAINKVSNLPITASGTGVSTGSAAIGLTVAPLSITASGTGQTYGAAALSMSLVATGTGGSTEGARTPPYFVAAGTSSAAASGDITVPIPAGTQAGDIAVLLVSQTDNVDSTVTAGWEIGSSTTSGPNHRGLWAWKRLVGGDSNPTVTHTGGDSIIGQISVYRDAIANGNPFGDATSGARAAVTSIIANSISPTVDGALVLFMVTSRAASTFSNWSGTDPVFVERIDSSTTLGLDAAIGLASGNVSVAGSMGTRTVDQSIAAGCVAFMSSLVPGIIVVPSTAGSAALTANLTLSASGTGATAGTATLTREHPVTASGTGQTSGAADIRRRMPVTASGSGLSQGSAALTARFSISAGGTGIFDGTALIGGGAAISASGSGVFTGSAAIGIFTGPIQYAITGTGTGQTGGSAALKSTLVASASGTGLSGGSAAIARTLPISASGAGLTAGTPAFIDGYLDPMVGTVTTPDPGPLPAGSYTFVVETVGPVNTNGTIVGQAENHATDRSWIFQRIVANGNLNFLIYTAGTATPTLNRATGVQAISGGREILAGAVTVDNGGGLGSLATWRKVGGVWSSVSTANATAPLTTFDSSQVVRVGGITNTSGRFEGLIYSVELRTGTDPNAGTVVWRFDANEYPGEGASSYTDPRGRTWTLATPSAITPRVPDVGPGVVLRLGASLSASGTGQTGGAAALTSTLVSSASGTGATTGSASIIRTWYTTASGSGTFTGSAALTIFTGPIQHAVTGQGFGQTGGSAALKSNMVISAAGTGISTGSAALQATLKIAAGGTGLSGGSASIVRRMPLAAQGTGQTDGSATTQHQQSLSASGSGQTGGSATVGLAVARQVTASGTGQTSGSAKISLGRIVHDVALVVGGLRRQAGISIQGMEGSASHNVTGFRPVVSVEPPGTPSLVEDLRRVEIVTLGEMQDGALIGDLENLAPVTLDGLSTLIAVGPIREDK